MSKIKQRFLADVARHEMTILRDDGIYRHLRFGRPNSSFLSFNIVTWPGYLAITGDCNDYVFTRTRDMFEFFRIEPVKYAQKDWTNPEYWSEKAVAVNKTGQMEVFSEERYIDAIRRNLTSHISEMSLSDAKKVVFDVKEDLLSKYVMPGSVEQAVTMAEDWKCPITDCHPFQDFWDCNLLEYSFGFLWAIQAVQWAIVKYDEHKAAEQAAEQAQEQTAEAPVDLPAYQARVATWVSGTFGKESLESLTERAMRVAEESAELAQALGLDEESFIRVARDAFARAPGEPGQEAGGLINVLAAACAGKGLDLWEESLRELARVEDPAIVEKCRRKHAEKIGRGVALSTRTAQADAAMSQVAC